MPNRHREHVRVNRHFAIRYRLPWSARWRTATTRDISAGGVSFVVPQALLLSGLPVEVEVDFPIAAFRSRARVARTRRTAAGREIGLAFTRLPEEARDNLGRYSYLCQRTA